MSQPSAWDALLPEVCEYDTLRAAYERVRGALAAEHDEAWVINLHNHLIWDSYSHGEDPDADLLLLCAIGLVQERRGLICPTAPPNQREGEGATKDTRRRAGGKKKRRKLEFSKIIFIGTTAVTLTVTAFSLVMMWRTQDISPLTYLIPAVFAETATATGFYYRKAEKENTKGGIVYDTAMAQMGQQDEEQPTNNL